MGISDEVGNGGGEIVDGEGDGSGLGNLTAIIFDGIGKGVRTAKVGVGGVGKGCVGVELQLSVSRISGDRQCRSIYSSVNVSIVAEDGEGNGTTLIEGNTIVSESG